MFFDKQYIELREYNETIEYINMNDLDDSYMLLARVNDIYIELDKDDSFNDLYNYINIHFPSDIFEKPQTNNDILKCIINRLNKRHKFILIIDIISKDQIINIFLFNNL